MTTLLPEREVNCLFKIIFTHWIRRYSYSLTMKALLPTAVTSKLYSLFEGSDYSLDELHHYALDDLKGTYSVRILFYRLLTNQPTRFVKRPLQSAQNK